MKEGDTVRVINGEHKGKIGIIKVEQLFSRTLEGERLERTWMVEFNPGEIEALLEYQLEVIEPE